MPFSLVKYPKSSFRAGHRGGYATGKKTPDAPTPTMPYIAASRNQHPPYPVSLVHWFIRRRSDPHSQTFPVVPFRSVGHTTPHTHYRCAAQTPAPTPIIHTAQPATVPRGWGGTQRPPSPPALWQSGGGGSRSVHPNERLLHGRSFASVPKSQPAPHPQHQHTGGGYILSSPTPSFWGLGEKKTAYYPGVRSWYWRAGGRAVVRLFAPGDVLAVGGFRPGQSRVLYPTLTRLCLHKILG